MNIEQFFNDIAVSYDGYTENKNEWMAADPIGKRLLQLSSKNSRILDIGIGTGQIFRYLLSGDNYKSLFGVDISKKMLKICKHKIPDIKLFHGEVFSVKGEYDIITCCGMFQFVDKPKLFLKHVRSLLKPGGIFIINYEPIISNHYIQKCRKSQIKVGTKDHPFKLSSCTHRYSILEMFQMLTEAKFNVLADYMLVAYKKLGHDVIYHNVEVN